MTYAKNPTDEQELAALDAFVDMLQRADAKVEREHLWMMLRGDPCPDAQCGVCYSLRKVLRRSGYDQGYRDGSDDFAKMLRAIRQPNDAMFKALVEIAHLETAVPAALGAMPETFTNQQLQRAIAIATTTLADEKMICPHGVPTTCRDCYADRLDVSAL